MKNDGNAWRGRELRIVCFTVDRSMAVTTEDLHAILRCEICSRLITKLEMAFSRMPLDMDFLDFTCWQELYLREALSKHVNVPPQILYRLYKSSSGE